MLETRQKLIDRFKSYERSIYFICPEELLYENTK